jgi:uncharacterized membrane protein YdjX (TVP38/TMEM64 family)
MNEPTEAVAFPSQRGAVWRRAAILALLTLTLAALTTSTALHTALVDVLAVIDSVVAKHPVLGAVLFVVLAAISAMLAFVSVAVILPVAVFTWGEPLSILLLWIGWTLGGLCTYAIGRFLGRAALRWLTAEKMLQRLERHVGPGTPFGVVFLFQLALPSEIPGYVLGLVRYSLPKYLLVLGIVELLYALAVVRLGAGFVERSAGIVLTTGAAVVLLSVAAFALLRKKMP